MNQETWVARAARLAPRSVAYVDAQGSRDYATVARRAREDAGRLRAIGVASGARVASLLRAASDMLPLLHAAQAIGAPLVPLNARLTVAELAPQLSRTRPALIVCRAADHETLEQAARGLPGTRIFNLEELPAVAPTRGVDPIPLNPAGVHAVLFTSGTTGSAKGVELTHANQEASAAASALRLGTGPTDRWLLCMPTYHVGGLAILVRAALAAATVVMEDSFDAERVATHLVRGTASVVSLVPTMLGRVLDAMGERTASPRLRCVLIGGAAMPPALLERARRASLPIAATYGLTEAASQVATTRPEDLRVAPESVGWPLDQTRVRIVDGEICVSGAQVMRGYLDDPQATKAVLRDGWLHTGDSGELDPQGRLRVRDRRVDLIVSGGENVYPAEVEAALLRHPDVAEACVIGRPDPEWGQCVEAHVVVCGEGRPAERELVAFCRRELAGFKVPRSFVFAETLPRTSSGKLQRGTLRAANAAPASLAACSPEEPAGRSGILAGEEGAVKLESEFTVERHRDEVVGIFDDDATFEAIMPDTRIVKREGDVRHTVTPYAAMGQSGEARFVFTTLVDGNLRFEKICDGNVWRALEGEVTLDEDGPFTRVALRMEGRTRALVPELAIRGPLREQLEQMADSLRRRLESA